MLLQCLVLLAKHYKTPVTKETDFWYIAFVRLKGFGRQYTNPSLLLHFWHRNFRNLESCSHTHFMHCAWIWISLSGSLFFFIIDTISSVTRYSGTKKGIGDHRKLLCFQSPPRRARMIMMGIINTRLQSNWKLLILKKIKFELTCKGG